MSISAYTFTANSTVSNTTLVKNGSKLKVAKGERYRFVDANGNPPQGLQITQVGSDAKVEWLDADSPAGGKSALTLENFNTTPDVAISAPGITPSQVQGLNLAGDTSFITSSAQFPGELVSSYTEPTLTGAAVLGAGWWMGVTGIAVAAGASGGGSSTPPTPDTLAPGAPTIIAQAVSNDATPVVSGTAEAGSTITVTIGGATYTTVATGGNWSIDTTTAVPTVGTFTPIAAGSYAVTATATDTAGNQSGAATSSVSIDTIAPTVLSVSDNLTGTANTATTSVVYTYTFSESVTGLAIGDFTATNGTVTAVSGSGTTWSVTVTPTAGVASGNITLDLAASAVQDSAGNQSAAHSQSAQAIDTVAPNLSALSLTGDADKTAAEATSAGGVNTLTAESGAAVRITYTGANGNTVFIDTTGTGAAQTVALTAAQVTALGQGAVTVSATATDAAGNTTTQSGAGFTLDTLAPSVTISDATPGTANSAVTYTFAFSESVTGFDANDVMVDFGVGAVSLTSIAGYTFSGSGASYTATFNAAPSFQGNAIVTVAASVAQDTAGNNNTAAASYTQAYDTAAPTVINVAIVNAPADHNYAVGSDPLVQVRVTFSEAVVITGTPTIDLNIGGTVVQATYNAVTGYFEYTVTSTALSDANGLAVNANSLAFNGGTITDAAGNAAVITHAAVAENLNHTVGKEIHTIVGTAGDDDTFTNYLGSSNTHGALAIGTGPIASITGGNRIWVGDDSVFADDGNDLVFIYAADVGGNDTIEGGNGARDTLIYSDLHAAITIDLSGATQTVNLGASGRETISGFEQFVLGQGNDVFIGGNDAVIVYDHSGNDTITGSTADDYIIDSDNLADLIDGGAGIDTLGYSWDLKPRSGGITVSLATGTDTDNNTIVSIENLSLTNFADSAIGSSADNYISARDGNDTIDGGDGRDTIEAGEGNDSVRDSDLEADNLNGENGSDTLDFSGVDTTQAALGGLGLVIDLQHGITALATTPSTQLDTISNFEYVIGTGANDSITGSALSDTLDGSAGADYIDGYRGDDVLLGDDGFADTLQGGEGADVIYGDALDFASYQDAVAGVSVNLANGGAAFGISNDGDRLYVINNLIGSGNADTLIGNTDINLIFSGAGDDILDGGDGDDHLFGGEGSDTIIGGNGVDKMRGGDGGGAAGSGDDVFILSDDGSADDINGEDGTNTVRYDNAGAALSIDLRNAAGGTATEASGAVDTLTNIQNVYASAFDDIIYGSDTAGSLFGGAGNDLITIGAATTGYNFVDAGYGNDTITTGRGDNFVISGDGDDLVNISNFAAGNDVHGDAGSDTISFAAIDTALNGGGLSINLGVGVHNAAGGTINTNLYQFEHVIGTGDNDTITGLDGTGTFADNNILAGGRGADSIMGLGGNDTLIGNDDSDSDTLVGGEGSDSIVGGSEDFASYEGAGSAVSANLYNGGASTGIASGISSGIDILDGIQNLIGSDYGDTLIGNASNNTIFALAGDNYIDAGEGDNSVTAHSNNDTIYSGSGNDTIDAGKGLNLVNAGDGDNEITVYSTGGSGSSTVYSGTGNDIIFAYDGDHRIYSGDGRDNITTTDGANTIVAGDGDDRITTGIGSNSILAGNGNDVITTADGDDYIDAGADDDEIYSGTGNDTIYLGLGNNRIKSDRGDDLIFAANNGNDTIIGGDDVDTLSYAGALGALDIVVNDVVREFDALGNPVSKDDITASDIEHFIASNFADTIQLDNRNDIRVEGMGGDDLIYDDKGDATTIEGGDGNDTIYGAVGKDVMDGGNGNGDWLSYETAVLAAHGAGGNIAQVSIFLDSVSGSVAYEAGDANEISNFENFYLTDTGNPDEFDGGTGFKSLVNSGNGSDIINLGDLNDTFQGWAGGATKDTVDGGDGFDMLDYSLAVGLAFNVNLSAGNIFDSTGPYEITNNFEGFIGADGNDNIIGSGSANLFYGGAGNDTIQGGAGGSNTMDSDTIYGEDGDDYVDAANFSVGSTAYVDLGNDNDYFLTKGISHNSMLTVIGGAGNDTIFFSSINYSANNAGNGTATLNTGEGDDVMYFDNYATSQFIQPIYLNMGDGFDELAMPGTLDINLHTNSPFYQTSGVDLINFKNNGSGLISIDELIDMSSTDTGAQTDGIFILGGNGETFDSLGSGWGGYGNGTVTIGGQTFTIANDLCSATLPDGSSYTFDAYLVNGFAVLIEQTGGVNLV